MNLGRIPFGLYYDETNKEEKEIIDFFRKRCGQNFRTISAEIMFFLRRTMEREKGEYHVRLTSQVAKRVREIALKEHAEEEVVLERLITTQLKFV